MRVRGRGGGRGRGRGRVEEWGTGPVLEEGQEIQVTS